jgi:hypothetical protein
MDVDSFMKRIILIGLVSALPALVNVASAHGGGGFGTGGSGGSSGGGHGSSGSSGSGASSGGHSSSVSSGGHSSSVSGAGHSSSVSKGGDPASAPGTAMGGHSMSNGSIHSSIPRSRPEPISNFRHFSTGYGHGDWQAGTEKVDWTRYHGRRLFGFIWY